MHTHTQVKRKQLDYLTKVKQYKKQTHVFNLQIIKRIRFVISNVQKNIHMF